jgi:hypothetical protein
LSPCGLLVKNQLSNTGTKSIESTQSDSFTGQKSVESTQFDTSTGQKSVESIDVYWSKISRDQLMSTCQKSVEIN